MNRWILLALAWSLGALAQAAENNRPQSNGRTVISPELRESLVTHTNLTYAKYGERTLELDLFRPKDAQGPLPGVVCVHGGGWANGTRRSHENLAMALAAKGFVAVTISYRLSGEAPFPAAIHDCKAAVRWMRANAREHGIDPDHIGAAGLSAGGHLVALLGTSAGVEVLEGNGGNPNFSSAVQAVVPMGAQTHLMSERNREVSANRDIYKAFLGGSQEEQPQQYQLASPMTHLDAEDPPMLFLSGENDDPSTHAEEFRARLMQWGKPADYIAVPNAPHAFMGQQVTFDFCIEKTASFLLQHLKL